MNKQIIEKLRLLKPVLRDEFGIEEFAIFGSVARGDDTKESDIDIAIIKAKKRIILNCLKLNISLRKS